MNAYKIKRINEFGNRPTVAVHHQIKTLWLKFKVPSLFHFFSFFPLFPFSQNANNHDCQLARKATTSIPYELEQQNCRTTVKGGGAPLRFKGFENGDWRT